MTNLLFAIMLVVSAPPVSSPDRVEKSVARQPDEKIAACPQRGLSRRHVLDVAQSRRKDAR